MYEYKGTITRVVDGDTVDATLDLGFGIKFSLRVRIDDYDAPETWRPSCDEELQHGLQATKRAKELLEGKEAIIRTTKLGIYGRYGASIFVSAPGRDEANFANIMISEGFAKRKSYEKPKTIIRS